MSVIRHTTPHLRDALVASVLAGSLCILPSCSVFAARNQSTVAQGKYYDAGNAREAEFFIGLYLLQVEMEQAPHVPELERLNLAHALGLTPRATTNEVGQRLHEEALKQSRVGLRMRLDQSPSSTKPDAASAAVRTSERPKESATVALLNQVETSSTSLLRTIGQMQEADTALDSLELAGGGLDASVDKDFASAPAAKLKEVQKNLEDAHQLIALMKTRAAQVRTDSSELLSAVAKAVNTDDGSLGSAASDAAAEVAKSVESAENAKKAATKARPKAKPTGGASAPAAARPRPPPRNDDGEAPASKPTKPSKPAPPRDFEP
ncbi:MAG: hypothetical protein ABI488_12625 [Polyangiaceae bacterium]